MKIKVLDKNKNRIRCYIIPIPPKPPSLVSIKLDGVYFKLADYKKDKFISHYDVYLKYNDVQFSVELYLKEEYKSDNSINYDLIIIADFRFTDNEETIILDGLTKWYHKLRWQFSYF